VQTVKKLNTLKQLFSLNKKSSNVIQINPQINLSYITQNVIISQKSKLALSLVKLMLLAQL